MGTPELLVTIGGVVSVVVSVSTFFRNHFTSKDTATKDFNRAQLDAQRASELSKIFLEYERRFTKLEVQAELFYKVIEKDIGDMLHSPHRPELDKLIEKNNDKEQELTRNEAIRFVQLLEEILDHEGPTTGERFGITALKASLISRFELWEMAPV